MPPQAWLETYTGGGHSSGPSGHWMTACEWKEGDVGMWERSACLVTARSTASLWAERVTHRWCAFGIGWDLSLELGRGFCMSEQPP